MRITGNDFYISAAELEAGSVSDPSADWNRACTLRNYEIHTELGGWHFRLPGLYMDGYLDSLRKTVANPELHDATCFDETYTFHNVQELASQILEILDAA